MRSNDVLVSIVIPAYNAERFIARCIESATKQSYKNIEIIVVNDGSSDKTLAIAEEIASTDSRIRIIDKDNGGVSSAREAGIKRSRGKYLMFIDSDDYVEGDYVEYFLNLIRFNGGDYDMAVNYNRFSLYETKQIRKETVDITSPDYIAESIYVGRIHEAVWNKIYKTSFLKANRISFNNEIWYGEGMLFNMVCLYSTKAVPVGNRRVYHQYFNKDSAMRKFNLDSNKCGLRSMDLQYEVLNRNNARLINAWRFHRNCFNMSILKGIIKTGTKNKYKSEYKNCIKSLRRGWYYPWKARIPFLRKVFFVVSGIAPVTAASLFVAQERIRAKHYRALEGK